MVGTTISNIPVVGAAQTSSSTRSVEPSTVPAPSNVPNQQLDTQSNSNFNFSEVTFSPAISELLAQSSSATSSNSSSAFTLNSENLTVSRSSTIETPPPSEVQSPTTATAPSSPPNPRQLQSFQVDPETLQFYDDLANGNVTFSGETIKLSPETEKALFDASFDQGEEIAPGLFRSRSGFVTASPDYFRNLDFSKVQFTFDKSITLKPYTFPPPLPGSDSYGKYASGGTAKTGAFINGGTVYGQSAGPYSESVTRFLNDSAQQITQMASRERLGNILGTQQRGTLELITSANTEMAQLRRQGEVEQQKKAQQGETTSIYSIDPNNTRALERARVNASQVVSREMIPTEAELALAVFAKQEVVARIQYFDYLKAREERTNVAHSQQLNDDSSRSNQTPETTRVLGFNNLVSRIRESSRPQSTTNSLPLSSPYLPS